uniref:Uncharacterized protein n=1 Tax=Serinus canaria TaxID=9135 RepID=A0A8C9MIM9_SERCA
MTFLPKAGSIISIGVKWLMAPDCSQVSEKKSFSLGSRLCNPPRVLLLALQESPSRLMEMGPPRCPRDVCRAGDRQELSAGIPSLVPNPPRGLWQDRGGTIWLKAGTGTFDKYYCSSVLLAQFSATTGKERSSLFVPCLLQFHGT